MKKSLFLIFIILGLSMAHSQDLMSYIQEAEANNLEIQAYSYRYDVATEKTNEVNSLPNTELGFGVFTSEPETRTGAQKMRFSIKQMMPWFGTITARQNYTSSIANALYEDLVVAQRQLRMAVSQSYYKLYAISAKREVLQENAMLLATYETIILKSVEVGNASLLDVLKLQMRKNDIDRQIKLMDQQYLSEQTVFNHLLNRDVTLDVIVVSNLTLPDHDRITSELELDLHPELIKFDRLYESVVQSELVNKKEAAPSIGIGIDYIPVEARHALSFSDNGKDIMMPMVSLSVPVFSHKKKSITAQNNLKQKALTAEKNNRKNILTDLLVAAISEQQSAKISFDTFASNIEKVSNGLDLLLKNYENQIVNFKDILELQELQMKLKVSKIEAVKSYFVQSSMINYLSNN